MRIFTETTTLDKCMEHSKLKKKEAEPQFAFQRRVSQKLLQT